MKRGQTWMYPFDGFDWLGHFDGKSDLDIVADVRQACVDLKGHAVCPSGKTFVDLCARNVEAIAQMSEENSAAVSSVADTAHRLVSVSDELKASVSRFRV